MVDEGVVDGDVPVRAFKAVLKKLVPVALADAAGLRPLFVEEDAVTVEGSLDGAGVDGPDFVELDDPDPVSLFLQLVPGLRGLREQTAERDETGIRSQALKVCAGIVVLTVEDGVVVVGVLVEVVRDVALLPSRVADRDDLSVIVESAVQELSDTLVGGRRIDDAVRDGPQEREVEDALVAAPVVADEAGAVDGQDHFLVLHGHVVDDLVIGALQERRVDGEDRDEPALGHAAGKRHRELFGDADVEEAVREPFRELPESGAEGHGGRDGDDVLVLLREGAERLSEFCGKVGAALRRFTGHLVEAADAVEPGRLLFGEHIALPLPGHDMEQDRSVDELAGLERVAQRPQVVSVDGAHVVEAHVFEHVTGIEPVFQFFLDLHDGVDRCIAHERQFLQGVADFFLEAVVRGVRADAGEVHGE